MHRSLPIIMLFVLVFPSWAFSFMRPDSQLAIINFTPPSESAATQTSSQHAYSMDVPFHFKPEKIITTLNRSPINQSAPDDIKSEEMNTLSISPSKADSGSTLKPSGTQAATASAINEYITTYSTLVLAFVTTALAIYTFKLWTETKAMVLASTSTAENQLRAYMYIDHFKWLSHLDTSNNTVWWSLYPIWKNGGVTPATSVTFYTSFILTDNAMTDDFELPCPDDIHFDIVVVGPNSTMQASPIALLAADLLAIQNKSKHFYIFGFVNYNDVFQNTPKRMTKFCSRIKAVFGDPTKEYDERLNLVELVIGPYSRNNYLGDAPSSYSVKPEE